MSRTDTNPADAAVAHVAEMSFIPVRARPTCLSCPFWHPQRRDDPASLGLTRKGECRHHSPTGHDYFPETSATTSCGDHPSSPAWLKALVLTAEKIANGDRWLADMTDEPEVNP